MLGRTHSRCIAPGRARVLAAVLGRHVPRRASVLDIGCGDGTIADLMKKAGKDLSFCGAEVKAPDRCAIPFVLFDRAHLPFAESCFDVCMLVDVIHHTENPAAVLKETLRVSRGHVLIKDHVAETRLDRALLKAMDWAGNRYRSIASPNNFMSEAQWAGLFSEAGCRIAEYDTDIPLYRFPLSLVFRRDLHFVALLEKRATGDASSE